MTQEGFERACHALMAARTAAGDKCYFPKVYVSQDSPAFTEAAADYYNKQQHNIYGKPFTEIEEVTFEQAWKHTHNGEDAPANELAKVCRDVDSLYVHIGKKGDTHIIDEEYRKRQKEAKRAKREQAMREAKSEFRKMQEEELQKLKERNRKKVKPNKK